MSDDALVPAESGRDVFVSYASPDAGVANAIVATLEQNGIRCWIAPRDVDPGSLYADGIVRAINATQFFVLVLSGHAATSAHVGKELERASSKQHPILAVRTDAAPLTPAFEYFLSESQWIDVAAGGIDAAAARLISAIRKRVPPDPVDSIRAAKSIPSSTVHVPRLRMWRTGIWVGLVAIAAWFAFTYARKADERRAAAESAIAEAEALVQRDQYGAAFLKVRSVVEQDAEHTNTRLQDLWKQIVSRGVLRVAESGATLSYKPYDDVNDEWIVAGTTPMEQPIDLPRGVLRVRLEKPGFEMSEFAVANPGPMLESVPPDPFLETFELSTSLVLAESGKLPPDMALIPTTTFPVQLALWTVGLEMDEREVPAFGVARFEVSNREYKEFVDTGGYDNATYWQGLEFRDGERLLPWAEARARFVDRTGRAGPAEWELSAYPQGEADAPVSGVSWYEAVAYARFRQLSLPTLHHWVRAAFAPLDGFYTTAASVAQSSRFLADGPVEAHTRLGLGPWGTWNTAGNIREWIWNASADQRVALGGSWRDYASVYQLFQTARPMDRVPEIGIRLMKAVDPVPDQLLAPIENRFDEEYVKREPVSDDGFEAMRFQFATGARRSTSVNVERIADSDTWTLDEVVLTLGGSDTFSLYVALPRGKRGPFQPILYGPPANAPMSRRSNRDVIEQLGDADIVPNGGRALIMPIWAGTYQRVLPPTDDPSVDMDRQRAGPAAWHDDAQTTIAYLATREDMDTERMGFLGISWATHNLEPILLATDGRLKTGVLIGAGIPLWKVHPMIDVVNYAPRIRCPVLMVNGRFDSIFPYERSQQRLFELLGSPIADKKHVIYDVNHFAFPRNSMAKEVTDWFDKYLGPVE